MKEFDKTTSIEMEVEDVKETPGVGNDLDKIIVGDCAEGSEVTLGNSTTPDIRVFGRSINVVVVVVHISIFLYSSCFWMCSSVFPYLSKPLGVDPVTFGYLKTTYAVIQLAGSTIFGRFGDMFGSRLAMTLAILASASSYLLLYFASSVPLLFLSRIPSVFMHALQGGQMIVTDVSDADERANALGKLGLTYAFGLVVGTPAGGLVAQRFRPETAVMLAFLGSALNATLLFSILPPTPIVKRVPNQSRDSLFSFWKILNILKTPGVFFLLSVKIGTGIPMAVFQSMFSIVALEMFELAVDKNGYIMSYIGVLSMLVQGFVVKAATKRFSNLAILTMSASVMVPSHLLLSFVTDVWQVCVVLFPLVTSLVMQTVIATSALTTTVPSTDTGAILGLNMAANSMIRSVSPVIGGYMMGALGFPYFGYFGFVTSFAVTSVLLLKLYREQQ